jgi:sigma-E factor negative regulatory protein RseA
MVMDRISAFMDGETSRTEAQQAFLRLKQNDESCEIWKTFHLIGDVMRGAPELRDDYSARFRARIEQEPTLLAPRAIWRKSANHPAWSAAAALAAVAVVHALVITDNPLNPLAQIATAPKPETAQIAQTPTRPRPAPAANQGKVNEYLMAHQEFSPSTALQGVAPYVRTVSATHDGSGR